MEANRSQAVLNEYLKHERYSMTMLTPTYVAKRIKEWDSNVIKKEFVEEDDEELPQQ